MRLLRTIRAMTTATVHLNDTEKHIRNVLCNYCTTLNRTRKPENPVELRITGGWVRDKLLGKESNDLDVAVNVMTGEEFASGLVQWALEQKIDLGSSSTSLHTIKKNPDKSKHLETCTTKLFSLDVDFVNLRSEQYTNDSRVPIIQCGTAKEDALRRDATLNALFYNLNDQTVEDFTGSGLEDLARGVLRTPLPPKQTFLDDPLRVLRLIRFACRFDFTVDHDALEAMAGHDVADALAHKISRERIGVEMEKILTCDNVSYGIRLISHVGLTGVIFGCGPLHETVASLNDFGSLAEIYSTLPKETARAAHVFEPFFTALAATGGPLADTARSVLQDKTACKLLWLCVVLSPFRDCMVVTNPKKALRLPYAEVVLKEGLRFGKHDCAATATILHHHDGFFASYFALRTVTRSELGLFIRAFGSYFSVAMVYNAFRRFLDTATIGDVLTGIPMPHEDSGVADATALGGVVADYDALLAHIDKEGLENVAELKPLVDGKTIAKYLDRKPGPWMKSVTDEVLEWQLDHPNGTAEECLQYLKGKHTD